MKQSKGIGRFVAPTDAEIYIGQIMGRTDDFIHCQIWEGLDIDRLNKWFNNFTSLEERYFAARLLDGLIYRSRKQTNALINQLFLRELPEITNNDPLPDGHISDWHAPLKSLRDDPGIRIVPVIRSFDPPTKSGPLVARLVKRDLKLNDHWMIWPFHLEKYSKKGISVFVFIDDFLGTGTQFIKFGEANNLDSLLSKAYCIYAPLAAHATGITAIQARFPGLRVVSAELLDDTYNIFSEKSDCFDDGENTQSQAKKFYGSILDKFNLRKVGSGALQYGFGHLAMTYAFAHATPNASIPLLWYQGPLFHPLFDR